MDEPRVWSVAASLRSDVVAAEVISNFERSGIGCVLLKGPSFARWLYRGLAERPYVDVDILVDPSAANGAEKLLGHSGFELITEDLPLNRPRAAREWGRPSDGALVDLHSRIEGIGVDPLLAWGVLNSLTEPLKVAGREVRVFNVPARALHVALHAAQNGPAGAKSMQDLQAALIQLDRQTWSEAARLAADMDALPSFVTGLGLKPLGAKVVADLGLSRASTIESSLLAASLPSEHLSIALGWGWLKARPSMRAKFAYVAQKLVPPVPWMQQRYALARRGLAGLLFSYPLRWGKIGRSLLPGLMAWRKAHRRGIR